MNIIILGMLFMLLVSIYTRRQYAAKNKAYALAVNAWLDEQIAEIRIEREQYKKETSFPTNETE